MFIWMKGTIAGLIPPGALRCKEQGQKVFGLPRVLRVRHGREPASGILESYPHYYYVYQCFYLRVTKKFNSTRTTYYAYQC